MASSVPNEAGLETVPNRPGAVAVPQVPKVEAPPADVPCPRCGTKLVNPGSLGWCMKCGYCQSLEEEGAKKVQAALAPKKPSPLGILECIQLLSKVPDWVWQFLIGAAVIVVGAFAANFFLPPDPHINRALFSTITVGISVLVVFIVQIWLMVELAPKDEENRLSPWQLLWVFPVGLWRYAFRRLPETRNQVTVGMWAWVAIKCAVLLIGGLDFWFQYYKPKKIASRGLQDAVAAAAAMADGQNKSLEDSVKDLAGKADDLTKKKDDKVDKRPTEQCVILGYTVHPETNKLNGLILGITPQGDLVYAGTVKTGFTDEVIEEMMKRFAKLVRPTPIIRSLKIADAIWLKPEVFCEVHRTGVDKDGMLVQPNFKALMAGKQ